MHSLTPEQMHAITGGDKIAWFCGIIGVADVVGSGAVLLGATLVPGAGWFLLITSVACVVYGIAKA